MKNKSKHRSSYKKIVIRSLGIFLFLFLPLKAEVILKGEIEGTFKKGEYQIDSTIFVPKGKMLIFEPGCVVKAKQYNGIIVQGELWVNGTESEPCVLTKCDTSEQWNGVEIDTSGRIKIRNTSIEYGVRALEVGDSSGIIEIYNVTFDNNHKNLFVNRKYREDSNGNKIYIQLQVEGVPEKTKYTYKIYRPGPEYEYKKIPKIEGQQEGFYNEKVQVSDQIIVPKGKKLEFGGSARVYFPQFAGITVNGELKIDPSASLEGVGNDTTKWNGIDVSEKGKIDFEQCMITGAKCAVSIHDSSAIKQFKNVSLFDNFIDFRIGENTVFFDNNKTQTIEPVVQPKKEINKKQIVTFASLTGTVAAAALCGVYGAQLKDIRNEYKKSTKDADDKRLNYDNAKKNMILTGILSGAMLGLTITINIF